MFALLEETVEHYNSENRSVVNINREIAEVGIGTCLYVYDGKRSEGCAVGRKLTKVQRDFISKEGTRCNSLNVDELRSMFVRENIELGILDEYSISFLAALQKLHDFSSHWDKDGLTDLGKEKYNEIKTNYIL
jgi:hypothetical protein